MKKFLVLELPEDGFVDGVIYSVVADTRGRGVKSYTVVSDEDWSYPMWVEALEAYEREDRLKTVRVVYGYNSETRMWSVDISSDSGQTLYDKTGPNLSMLSSEAERWIGDVGMYTIDLEVEYDI